MNAILDLFGTSPALAALIVSTAAMFMVAIGFLVTASWLRRTNNRKAARWAELETTWGSLIEQILAGVLTPEALHQRVTKPQRLILLDYLYKQNQNEPDQARHRLNVMLAAPYLNELRRRAEKGDVWQRARAIRTIAELGGAAGSNTIKRGLDDASPHVAMTAARSYARLRLGPIEPLLDRAGRYGEWDRRLLRRTLASFGEAGTTALHRRFEDDTAPAAIRAVCADTLAELDYTDANDTALEVLTHESDVDLRAAALRVLRAPTADTHREMVRSLCGAPDPVIRSQAVACLGRIGDPSDENRLQRALADISPWVVLSAFRGLSDRRN